MRTLIIVFTLSILNSLLCAEDVRVRSAAAGDAPAERTISGPSLGVVAGETTGVRLVRGVPGAATLSGKLDVPALSTWTVSPDRDYLIGVTASSGRLVLVRDLSRAPQTSALARWGLREPVVVLSPTGGAAAVYDPGLKRIVVWKGLPEEPVLAWDADMTIARSELNSLAVRDDGERVLMASNGSLTEIARRGKSTHLAVLNGAGRVAYLARSSDVLYVDEGAKSVMLLRDGTTSMVAGAQDGITSPVAITASADGNSILVANHDPPGVVVIDREQGTVTTVPAPREPSALRRLSRGKQFQITGADEGATYVLSTQRRTPRLTFIPAPARADQGGAR
jgi:hypothetical protein